MTESLNIVVLPDEKTRMEAIALSEKIAKFIPTEFTLNPSATIPHITVYQGYYPQENVPLLIEKLEQMTHSQKEFSVSMNDFKFVLDTFLFWNCKKTASFQNLHETILSLAFPLRKGLITPNLQELLPSLTDEELERVKLTGGILNGPHFDPHITLTRIKASKDAGKVMELLGKEREEEFLVQSIALASLGQHGTISKVIHEFQLKS